MHLVLNIENKITGFEPASIQVHRNSFSLGAYCAFLLLKAQKKVAFFFWEKNKTKKIMETFCSITKILCCIFTFRLFF